MLAGEGFPSPANIKFGLIADGLSVFLFLKQCAESEGDKKHGGHKRCDI